MSENELTPMEVGHETQLVSTQVGSPEALEKAVQTAGRYFELHDRVRKLAICLTNHNDWVDQGDKPYLQFTGASKIANAFGLQTKDVAQETESLSDTNGDYIIVTTTGDAVWNGRRQAQIGTCSSRDKFIAQRTRTVPGEDGKPKKEQYLLPLSEIDVTQVKKKSFTNFLNRAIKNLMGLSFTWEEIEEVSDGKVTKALCTHFSYDKGKKGATQSSADAGSNRSEIRRMILEMCGNDTEKAKATLQRITTFVGKDGKTVSGRTSVEALSDKQLPYVLRDVKREYEGYLEALKTQSTSRQPGEDDEPPMEYGA